MGQSLQSRYRCNFFSLHKNISRNKLQRQFSEFTRFCDFSTISENLDPVWGDLNKCLTSQNNYVSEVLGVRLADKILAKNIWEKMAKMRHPNASLIYW